MLNKDKSKCSLFKTQIYDNLYNFYLFYDSGGGLSSRFSVPSPLISNNLSTMTGYIDSSVEEEVWTPVFATAAASTKAPYLEGNLNTKPVLGINEFFVLNNPIFKDLSIENNVTVGVDWFLNDVLNTDITPNKGVLFWYKKRATRETSSIIKNIPIGEWIYSSSEFKIKTNTLKEITIPAGQVCVKLNDNELQLIPINKINNTNYELFRSIQIYNNPLGSGGNIYEPSKIKLSSSSNAPSSWTIYNDFHYLKVGDSYYSIHISDGDYFSYYNTDNNLDDFLSFNLMSIYRTIYNNLINILGPTPVLTASQSLNLKRLASILATGPQDDKVTLNINGFYGSTSYISDIRTFLNGSGDAALSLSVCQNIYKESKKLETNRVYNTSIMPYKALPVDVNDNYSKVPNDIFHKLASKYGVYLRFSGDDAKITINKLLRWKEKKNNSSSYVGGPNISIDSRFIYWTSSSRNMTNEANSIPSPGNVGNTYYDQHIQAGPLRIQTDISNQLVYFKTLDSGSEEATMKAGLIKASQNPRINTDKANYIMIPEIKYSMFYKQGAFKIGSSTCYIDEPVGQQSMYNGKLDGKPIFLKSDKLSSTKWGSSGTKEYNFDDADIDSYKKPSLKFKLYTTGDVIKLDSLDINFLRYKEETLCSCDSFYREIINRSENYTKEINVNRFLGIDVFEQTPKKVGYGRAGYCDSVNLGKIRNTIAGVEVSEYVTGNVPGVSTKYSPPIISYGGYDASIVSELGVKLPSHPTPGEKLPTLESRNPNYVDETKCYERTGFIKDSSYYSYSADNTSSDNMIGSTVFQKGFFHPHYGWIPPGHYLYSNYSNKTAVVSYKPDKKSKFVFKGVGFLFDGKTNGNKNYSSKVSIDLGAQKTNLDELNIQTGIRDAGSQFSLYSSEYLCDDCIPYRGEKDSSGNFTSPMEKFKDNDCGNNYQPTVKYSIYPLKDFTDSTDIVGSGDINNLRIKDIDIKLNFVNFDNIQDMKITLKYNNNNTGSDTVPNTYYGLVDANSSPFVETSVNSYLSALAIQNPPDTIVLLNKEHIKQYNNEFTLRFSDYASTFSFVNPLNKTEPGEINFSSLLNTSVSDGEAIHPSYKPAGYSDKQTQDFREILNTYNVCIIDNKFRKWYGKPLIGSNFSLEIEITNNYNKYNYSNISDLHLKSNRDSDLLKSNVAKNSICSWQVIVDTYKTTDTTQKIQKLNVNHPASEHIDYTKVGVVATASSNPYSDGYNFLGDFTGRKFLVPPVNMNAPHQYLTDFNSCVYPDKNLNNFGFSRTEDPGLKYIYQAINLFSMGIGAAVGMAAMGGLTGAFVGGILFGAGSDLAVQSVVSYFGSLRRTALVDAYDSSFYDVSYDSYGYGVPDRALVEVSSDEGYTWYTFDAKIFKYNEYGSPVYQPLKLSYTGGGDPANTITCSKFSDTEVPATPSESSPIIADPDSFSLVNSLILSGQYIKAKELYIRKNIRLLDTSPNILNSSNVFIGFNQYDKDSTVCFEIPNVKPFYYLKSGLLSTSTNIDIIYYDKAGYNYRKVVNKTITNLNILNKDNIYNTYILLNDKDLKNNLEKSSNSKILIQKKNAENLLGINLYSSSGYLTLAAIKAINNNKFVPDYTMPVYGEGAWGRGSSSITLFPSKEIVYAKDLNLSDLAIGYSQDRYIGRLSITKDKTYVVVPCNEKIGLFDNINGWPLYKNIEKFNQNKILSDNVQYPYKNISNINSIFYLYGEGTSIQNKNMNSTGNIVFLDHLVPKKLTGNQEDTLEGFTVEAIYTANQIDGSPCFGGHNCNGAKFDIFINNVFIFTCNLNNHGQGGPPIPPLSNGVGLDSSDRYSSFTITANQAESIKSNNASSISISYVPAADNITPHNNITWIRILSPDGAEISSTCSVNSTVGTNITSYDDNKYWISIDKKQYGTYSRPTSMKVLNKIEYSCSEPRTVPGGLNCKNICGVSWNYARSVNAGEAGVTWTPIITTPMEILKIEAKPDAYDQRTASNSSAPTAIFTNTQADAHKAEILSKNPNIIWQEITFSRPDVRISCGDTNGDTLMYIKEYYWVAKDSRLATGFGNGIQNVKASEVLDTNDEILVRFKYNTRKLRHIDNFYKKYIISPNGSVSSGGIGGTDEMPIKNSFYSWFCNYVDRGTNTLNTVIPPYYMMLNEMIFRGFFGSADGLEFKTTTLKTQYPHEWIPYEYDNAVVCSNNTEKDNIFIASLHNFDQIGYKLRCWLLSKLVSSPSDKKKIVSKCLTYMNTLGGPGIVPDKKEFDYLYERKDTSIGQPRIQELIDTFLS